MKRIVEVIFEGYNVDAVMQYDNGSRMTVTMSKEDFALQRFKEKLLDKYKVSENDLKELDNLIGEKVQYEIEEDRSSRDDGRYD